MDTLLTVVHVVVCLFLVGIVLLQHGKGADIGATFGGSSQSLFGTEGPLPLLNKITTAAAVIFMLTSVTLAYISSQASKSSVMAGVSVSQPAAETATPLVTEEKVAIPAAEEKEVEDPVQVSEKVVEPAVEETITGSVTEETPVAEKAPLEESRAETKKE